MSDRNVEIQKRPFPKSKSYFKDLEFMMFGFGDSANPNPESVKLLEEIILEYINEICIKAAKVSGKRSKVLVDDFKFVLRKDHKKLARIEELIALNKEIENAKKMFKDSDFVETEENPTLKKAKTKP
ncbi:Transcription initiation factor TFIID subunit 13 [Zancudomyces culisetae]|uniref:Transcription initiation factor TFIID subunit 13 n=1 Tax=Zancudomyces culisetae TaxID=1213189 RepID=A0A1R1PNH6_ZANCU|nr:Transcription initiation factor TFIID subunit 13 [Zancudomyces culisetae]|eukprot:OMH82504.1 Transcription initiation factor TFIID subunit 13 [Zancudomyces culisetae]